MQEWLQSIQRRDKRALARLISRLENGDPDRDTYLEQLLPHTGRAHLIGITGPPGAGKSTLLDGLIRHLREQGFTVGVVAVDPTSPFTGGAILGDRVRMVRHALDEGVFIRSMGSRGHMGGLARAARDAVRVLDAAGFDVILIETVGVGQAELDIMHLADTVALVLHPQTGDVVQVFKAGIMEIADVFVVNKADLPGTQRLKTEIEELLDLSHGRQPWRPPVVTVIGVKEEGIDKLWEQFVRHRRELEQRGEWQEKRECRYAREVRDRLTEAWEQRLDFVLRDPAFAEEVKLATAKGLSPREVARRWWTRVLNGAEGGE
jgi:LAO/AO transport system kinase